MVTCDKRLLEEGSAGSRVIEGLVDAVHEFSTDVVLGKIIPHHGWGIWPHLDLDRDESEKYERWSKRVQEEECQAKVWHPLAVRECGLEGDSQDKLKKQLHMMARGMVVVVLVHSDFDCNYRSLGLSLDADAVDPTLLIWMVAVELKKMARSNRAIKVRAVFPIFTKGKMLQCQPDLKDHLEDTRKESDVSASCSVWWDLPHVKTADFAIEFLDELGLSKSMAEGDMVRFRKMTPRDIFRELTRNQGMFMSNMPGAGADHESRASNHLQQGGQVGLNPHHREFVEGCARKVLEIICYEIEVMPIVYHMFNVAHVHRAFQSGASVVSVCT